MSFMLFLLLLPTSAPAGECDFHFRKAVEDGPLDGDELLYHLKCDEKNAEMPGSYVCVIGGLAQREQRRNLGSLPVTVIASPSDRYTALCGTWHPHKGRYRGENGEITELAVTGNNFGLTVTRRIRQNRERFQFSAIEKVLRYEKHRGNQARSMESMEFSCVKVPLVEAPPEEPPRRRAGRLSGQGVAEPGKAGNGSGKSGAKSGVSGSTR